MYSMPASSTTHSPFWDRIPSAPSTPKAKGEHSHKAPHSVLGFRQAIPMNDSAAAAAARTARPARISKRKQSRPMRSPLALDFVDSSSVGNSKANKGLAIRNPGYSLFPAYPGSNGSHPSRIPPASSPGRLLESRAFRLSFSDDYSRNQHAYVQALLDSESLGSLALNSKHMADSSASSRSRRAGSRSHTSAARDSTKGIRPARHRLRSTRHHGLRSEQSIGAAQTDDDAHSTTTMSSDHNELTDTDAPGRQAQHAVLENSPLRADTSVAEGSGGDQDSKTAHGSDGSRQSTPLSQLSDGDGSDAGAEAGRGVYEDNMPSYTRLGQTLGDDVAQVVPWSKKSTVKWTKADPINVSDKPMVDKLAAAERHCCSILRILPEQYLTIKHTLLREGRTRPPGSFKKRDAQKLCRIDVNKTSKIYEWYVSMGWLPSSSGLYALPPTSALPP